LSELAADAARESYKLAVISAGDRGVRVDGVHVEASKLEALQQQLSNGDLLDDANGVLDAADLEIVARYHYMFSARQLQAIPNIYLRCHKAARVESARVGMVVAKRIAAGMKLSLREVLITNKLLVAQSIECMHDTADKQPCNRQCRVGAFTCGRHNSSKKRKVPDVELSCLQGMFGAGFDSDAE
jgi:hypothetical protein